VAFEPAFATYGVLCQNVVLNGAADAIVPLPVTLGERTELGRFAYRDLRAGAALHAGLAADPEAAYAQPVLVYGLDELVERFALPRPQHIKVDVDGAEPAVLRGAAGVLAAPSLRSALIELGARQEDEIEALMGAAGLRRIATHRGTEAAEDTVLYALYER
jgi:FkbM family methyltransferase